MAILKNNMSLMLVTSILILMVALISSVPDISAYSSGNIYLKNNTGWNLVKQEKGTIFYIDNKQSKTPLICEIYPEAKNKEDLPSRNIYTSKDKKDVLELSKSKSSPSLSSIALEKNKKEKDKTIQMQIDKKWADCYQVEVNEKVIQKGDNSTIIVYQDYSNVEYLDGDNNETITSFIIQKFNGTDYNIEPQNIWVKNESECISLGKDGGLCFGATDSSMNETQLANFRYIISSNSELNLIVNNSGKYSYPILYTNFNLLHWGKKNQFYSFKDICDNSYAKCNWSIENDTATITFTSTKYIDPTVFPGGNGTAGNPYQITNCTYLQAMNESLTSYYKLMNNIDCSGINFNPVKLSSIFYGGLDGQNYNITNLTISYDGSNRVGLFSDFSGTIKNVNIINANVTANYDVGVLVGYMRGGNITNCSVMNSKVTGTAGTGNIGGFVGRTFGIITNSFVFNSTVIGSSSSAANVGGFVGQSSSGSNISNSGVDKTLVLASGAGVTMIGGFVGRAESPFYKNYATNVNVSTGGGYIGGFVGYGATAASAMTQCWSSGTVTAGGNYAGGFIGRNSAPVTDCYSTANITSSSDYVGGFIGYTSTSTITNGYSTGLVRRTVGGSYMGGFAGRSAGGTITSCYYDNQTSNQTDTGKGTGKLTAQMKQQATFVGWDFATPIWYIIENQTYPSLLPLIGFPVINIVYPQNITYNINVTTLNYTYVDTYPGHCWYSNNSGILNSTAVNAGINFTNVISVEGSNTWTLYCNNSYNYLSSTNVTFFKDTINPMINITYPQNTTYKINVTILNYTYSDTNPGHCWYSNNSGIWNSTAVNAGTNYLNATSVEGSNTWTLYCNDTVGNTNKTNVTFFKDSITPLINITYPQNTTYNVNVSTLNYTVSDTNLQACWYSLNNGGTNITVTCGQNLTGLISNEGSNTWTVWANDTLGNVNSSSVTFFKDTVYPLVNITYPQNITYYVNVSTLNYTYSDTNPGYCWYSNNSGVWNSTAISAGTNFTDAVSEEGSNTWTLYCNDTLGNMNSSSVTFFKSTVVTDIDFVFTPTKNTYLKSSLTSLKSFCFDVNYDYCYQDIVCTLNIYYPNSSLMINTSLMTWTSNAYIYNLSSSQTSITGNYNGWIMCSSINQTRTSSFTYSISNTGNNINDDVNNVSTNVWSYANRSLTYNIDMTNYTQVALNVWNYNGTINSNILNQIIYSIWNYAGSVTTVTNQIAQSAWGYSARYTHGEILD